MPHDDAQLQTVDRKFLSAESVIVNEGSNTVHVVVCVVKGAARVKCAYIPPDGAKAVSVERLTGSDLYTCGTCCGKRRLLLLD